MNCEKCGGLVVKVDDDELKCTNCSKRVYKGGGVPVKEPHLSVVPMNPDPPQDKRCQQTLAARGTQCRTWAVKGTKYCKRHAGGSDGLVKMIHERRKLRKPATTAPSLAVTVTRERAVQISTPTDGPIPYLLPVHLSFAIPLNDPENWIAFGRTWQDRYKGFALVACQPDPATMAHTWLIELEKAP